jgi:glycosyltransferase involved in cell wall biosynthesis
MRVGITAEALNNNGSGIKTYSNYLIKKLNEIENLDICLIEYENCTAFPSLNKILISNPFSFISKLYLWHPYLTLKLNSNKYNLDIVHSLNTGPSFFKLKKQKYVITVHDLIPLVFPRTRPSKVFLIYKYLLPRTLRKADKIIAVSNSTKLDLIKYFNIPAEKIEVIYEAADERFKLLSDGDIKAIKNKYNLSFPFILYVSGLAPHKNLIALIKAFHKVKLKGIDHKLVISGKKRWKYKEIFDSIDALHLQDDVVFTGYVPDDDLPGLYNAADLFVYPSLYEGFGLPPLEAMACGCPVIASNTSSIPEVVGDAGILFNPQDIDTLNNSICNVLKDNELRMNMSNKSLERAKIFSWDKCAVETFKIYLEVHNTKISHYVEFN